MTNYAIAIENKEGQIVRFVRVNNSAVDLRNESAEVLRELTDAGDFIQGLHADLSFTACGEPQTDSVKFPDIEAAMREYLQMPFVHCLVWVNKLGNVRSM